MVESTIDKIKDITVERQIRKLAGVIDEQNQKIDASADYSTDIKNLQDTTVNQGNQINNLKQQVATDKLSTESAITNLQSKDSAQDVTLATHDSQIQGITKSLVSDVQILDGITTGEIKVRIDREDAASIDSNSYSLGLPVSAEIIQGTGPSMFKIQITMSSGVKVVSNDFVFTTEAIGTDVYISSFTFKAGNQDGYLSADIGLNNGVTIEANNFLVPTDPNVIANITDLQVRMTNVESTAISDSRITAIETKNTEQDTKISELEAKNTTQDTAIQKNATDISSLNTEVSGVMSDLGTKVDLTNPSQIIKADTTDLRTVKLRDSSDAVGSYLQFNAASDKPIRMEYFNGSEVVDSGYVATVDGSGNPKNFTIPSGGEEWEEINFDNFPSDWVVGDLVRMNVQIRPSSTDVSKINSWTTNPASVVNNHTISYDTKMSNIIEFMVKEEPNTTLANPTFIPVWGYNNGAASPPYFWICYIDRTGGVTNLNNGNLLLTVMSFIFNGAGSKVTSLNIKVANHKNYINKMWRLKR